LFDLMGGGGETEAPVNALESAPKATPVEDFPESEKLRLEKELLGFYISNHPLREVAKPARLMAPISLANLESQPENMTLSAIVLITEVKPIVTKKGDRMAIAQIEDLTGKTEAVIFPKSFERIGEHIRADQRLMIWGKVDRRDEQIQFILDDAEPIEEVRFVMVEIPALDAANIQVQQRIKEVLRSQSGETAHDAKVAVVAKIQGQQESQFVRLGAQFRVQNEQATVDALKHAGFNATATGLMESVA
jgi:DNA polymerase-3 subunit alpha